MGPDIQLILEAERLTKALQNLGSMIKKNPDIKEGLQSASKYLINQGKQRLRARISNNGGLDKTMTYTLWASKRGSLIGFRTPEHAIDQRTKWESMRPWVVDLGSYKGKRHTRKGANRGIFKGTKFWTETNEQDANKAMNMVIDSIERSINKIMSR